MIENAGAANLKIARPPAGSRLLKLYTRLVPLAARNALRERVPASVRSKVARRLTMAGPVTRLADRVTASRVTHAHPEVERPGFGLVRVSEGTFAAHVDTNANASDARLDTIGFVLGALAAAGVPAFRIRPYHSVTTAVGISSLHRDEAFAALERASESTPVYVSRVADKRIGNVLPAEAASSWRRLANESVVRVIRFVTEPTGQLVYGARYGCDIEIWRAEEGMLHAPRPNRMSDEIPERGTFIDAPESVFSRHHMPPSTPTSRTRAEFGGRLLDDIDFPIDAVYTWVDGAEPRWRARRDAALRELLGELNGQAANESRYTDRDELRYSLRSLHQYAPWINHIWIVTDDQVPAWLDLSNPRITVVSHRELFGDRGVLPTFNSHAIESQLHRIEGLAEHFLYFNDDVMLGRPAAPQLFFHANGVTKFFPSTAKIDTREPSIDDVPVTAAGKNNRQLIAWAFDRTVTYKMKHCPHALRRSVLDSIEATFPEAMNATASHQFRHVGDVSVPSALYHYFAHARSLATVGELRYMYTDLADPNTAHRLRLALARRNFDVMCLNDTDTLPDALQQDVLGDFLACYFPVAAPWERVPVIPRQRVGGETVGEYAHEQLVHDPEMQAAEMQPAEMRSAEMQPAV